MALPFLFFWWLDGGAVLAGTGPAATGVGTELHEVAQVPRWGKM
ncbi:hypothetical protein [Mesorhizobium sp. SP-1A]|nr:hypothetical protein [Mesorhizobium sp. SP-1A]